MFLRVYSRIVFMARFALFPSGEDKAAAMAVNAVGDFEAEAGTLPAQPAPVPAPVPPVAPGIRRARRGMNLVEMWADHFRIVMSRGHNFTTLFDATCPHHRLSRQTAGKKRATFNPQDARAEG